jgi:hypothetical protein
MSWIGGCGHKDRVEAVMSDVGGDFNLLVEVVVQACDGVERSESRARLALGRTGVPGARVNAG